MNTLSRTIVNGLMTLTIMAICSLALADEKGIPTITVYKSPTCSCCERWIEHLQDNGFRVEAHNLDNMYELKLANGITSETASCHTALIENYVVEGHVPADVIKKLLAERPDVKGISVPGMPLGSPGMESNLKQPYDVLTFDARGNVLGVYASRVGQEAVRPSQSRGERLAEGGRLYDKWWAEYGLEKPSNTHPAYPSAGKKTGGDTWRCKECHGWDYQGKDGAYGKGGHFTGIPGIRNYAGAAPDQVVKIVTDDTHQYSKVLPDPAIDAVARFVVGGQIDMDRYIDAGSKQVKGDKTLGRRLFDEKCARCHGEDGANLNFSGDPGKPEFVGTVAANNPWEALHKIRNGQPGSKMPMMHEMMGGSGRSGHGGPMMRGGQGGPMMRGRTGMMGKWHPGESMPAMIDLSEDQQAAILAYIQTLPSK